MWCKNCSLWITWMADHFKIFVRWEWCVSQRRTRRTLWFVGKFSHPCPCNRWWAASWAAYFSFILLFSARGTLGLQHTESICLQSLSSMVLQCICSLYSAVQSSAICVQCALVAWSWIYIIYRVVFWHTAMWLPLRISRNRYDLKLSSRTKYVMISTFRANNFRQSIATTNKRFDVGRKHTISR